MIRSRSILILAVLAGGCVAITAVFAAKPSGGGPTAISFVSMQQRPGYPRDIRGTTAAGGSQVTIVRDRGGVPRWSPDGTRLLFVEGNFRNEAIVSVAADGSDRRVLLTFPEVDAFNVAEGRPSAVLSALGFHGIFTADWSPDGTCLAFDALTGYPDPSGYVWWRHRIYVVRLSDGVISRVTDGFDFAYSEHAVAWSESLNVIGFARLPTDGEGTEFWVAAPDGTWSRPLLTPESAGTTNLPLYFDWSHGGDPSLGLSAIAFPSQGGVLIAAVDLLAENPATVIQAIESPGFTLDYPSWSPDDTSLVFTRADAARWQLATHDLASGAQKVLIQEDAARKTLLATDWRRIP